MSVTTSYAWFLPKAYAWLGRLIDTETLREIAKAEDIEALANAVKKTRLSGAVQPVKDVRAVGRAIRRFYKQEVSELLSMVPESFRRHLERTLLHVAVTEAFSAAKNWIRGSRELTQEAEVAITLPREFFERLSRATTRNIDTLKAVLQEFARNRDKGWAGFILRGLKEAQGEPLSVIEPYLYLKALEEALISLSEARRGYSIDTSLIVCPYFDLEGARTLALVLHSLGGLPRLFQGLKRVGCVDIVPEERGKDLVVSVYNVLAKRYKVPIAGAEDLVSLDLRLGEALRNRMAYYARKAFSTYPFSVNVPLSLLLLLLDERARFLRALARIEYKGAVP